MAVSGRFRGHGTSNGVETFPLRERDMTTPESPRSVARRSRVGPTVTPCVTSVLPPLLPQTALSHPVLRMPRQVPEVLQVPMS